MIGEHTAIRRLSAGWFRRYLNNSFIVMNRERGIPESGFGKRLRPMISENDRNESSFGLIVRETVVVVLWLGSVFGLAIVGYGLTG